MYNITRARLNSEGRYRHPQRLNLGLEDTHALLTLAQGQTAMASVTGQRYEYHITTPTYETHLYYSNSAAPWRQHTA